RDLRPDVDLGGEPQRLPVLDLDIVDLRPPQRLHLVLTDGGQELLRDRLLHRLVQHHVPADPLIDHRPRGLAAAEARDGDLLRDLAVGLVQRRLKLREGHFDGELHPGRTERLDRAFHARTPWIVRIVTTGVGRRRDGARETPTRCRSIVNPRIWRTRPGPSRHPAARLVAIVGADVNCCGSPPTLFVSRLRKYAETPRCVRVAARASHGRLRHRRVPHPGDYLHPRP